MNRPRLALVPPEQGKLRELEVQLQSSMKAHEDTKSQFENRMNEADSTYREKLEQLENDYQSAVHYVKGTEKMLKKMKEELTKYKSVNSQLQTELESSRGDATVTGTESAAWATERDDMQKSINEIKSSMTMQISSLEGNLAAVQRELAVAQEEGTKRRTEHEELSKSTQQAERELDQLRSENSMLQTRADEAEQRVNMLLDQVGTSVSNYRRQSQIQPLGANGISHTRDQSISTMTDTSSHGDEEGTNDVRGSLALDSLASELETLRTQWESTSRTNYRLSNQFDFEKTPTKETGSGPELNDNLTSWRRRLDEEEKTGGPSSSGGGKA